MKSTVVSLVLSLIAATPAFAVGTHTGGHDAEIVGPMGQPGVAANVSRTLEVVMSETADGEMTFEPKVLDLAPGETVRLAIRNAGEMEHELVLGMPADIQEHKALMEKFPEMEHADANSVRLQPGEASEIIWQFADAGAFEFACLIPGHYEAGMKGEALVNVVQESTVVEAAQHAFTKGIVKKIDRKSKKLTIAHEDLVSLGMPGMTMVFVVSDEAMIDRVKEGGAINFVADRVKGKLTVTQLK